MDEVSTIIGNTQLVKLEKVSQELGASVYVKYEASNPGASIKDRPARTMLDNAELRGRIKPGKTVLIEPTSGNTGIALALLAAVRGYRIILCMPESMSKERRALLAAYGAELVLTPASEGMAGAVARAEELEDKMADAWLVGQFVNPDNPLAHEQTTAPEIEKALGKAPDYLVAGVGTGGTITGCGHYFKAHFDERDADTSPGQDAAVPVERDATTSPGLDAATKIYAVEPAESPLITQTLAGEPVQPASHGIQGIGANFIPCVLDLRVLDGTLTVTTEEALSQAREIAKQEGLLVGISSGANIAAIRRLIKEKPEAKGRTIVSFLVDTGERYISTPLFEGLA